MGESEEKIYPHFKVLEDDTDSSHFVFKDLRDQINPFDGKSKVTTNDTPEISYVVVTVGSTRKGGKMMSVCLSRLQILLVNRTIFSQSDTGYYK